MYLVFSFLLQIILPWLRFIILLKFGLPICTIWTLRDFSSVAAFVPFFEIHEILVKSHCFVLPIVYSCIQFKKNNRNCNKLI